MAVENPLPPTVWNRKDFDKMRAGWTQKRRDDDEKLLQKVYAAAADSPMLKEALDWARAHGVKVMVDRTAVNVAGYYPNGTGVVALCVKEIENNFAAVVGTLAHEIRHVWQDYNDLRRQTETGHFPSYFITNALIEADARAYGERARDEYALAQKIKTNSRLTVSLAAFAKRAKAEDLGLKFMGWFDVKSTTQFYGHASSVRYANMLNEKAAKTPAKPAPSGTKPAASSAPAKQTPPVRNYEFNPTGVKLKPTKLFIEHLEDVYPLGVSFNGTENYLMVLPPDLLPKVVIRPSLANTFWGAAKPEQIKLTNQIRKSDIRAKLAKPKKRHPWP